MHSSEIMAAPLKEAGNAAFATKDYASAHALYSEAISHDVRNAVLFANRSACCLGLERYVDALTDASRATQIDPGYAKGWSRLATAYEAVNKLRTAIMAWECALSALPRDNLTDAERKQQAQYAASLEKAKDRQAAHMAQPLPGIVSDAPTDRSPSQVAEEMLPELHLHAAGPAQLSSSAYVIYFANQEWQDGVTYMKDLKLVLAGDNMDVVRMMGNTDGLALMRNGVMRDMRVFCIEGSPVEWIKKYCEQVFFESDKHKAPISESVQAIQQLSLRRLKMEGWKSLRLALDIVVRIWIMNAIISARLKKTPHVAIEALKETLELLHWGRQVWRDVDTKDKGVIFEDAFIRGVKVIYLNMLLETHVKAASADKPVLLETLLNEARGLIEELENTTPPIADPSKSLDPGYISSFYVYPAAEAHAAVAYHFMAKAKTSENEEERTENYTLAAKEYTLAAEKLPVDEEKCCWYWSRAIEPMLLSGAPKTTMMSVVNSIREAMPRMQRIWGNSAMAKQGRDALIEIALQAAERGWGEEST